MKKLIILPLLLALLAIPVSAQEFTAPPVPESAERYMPETSDSFVKDLWYIISQTVSDLRPDITEAVKVCLSVVALHMVLSILESVPGQTSISVRLLGAISTGLLLLGPARAMIQLGTKTVQAISDYGKLLLPVMSAALAAQGGTSSATALHIGTVIFDTILTMLVADVLVPLVYIYLFVSITNCALSETLLQNLQSFCKWIITWGLKIILYVFTGFMAVTNVVSGTVDASALKATKLTISGMVPVVGNILSDATETLLVGVNLMKSSAGVYGILAVLSICVGPFLQIGIQYVCLKLTAGICSAFSSGKPPALVKDFSGAMGFLLAMTGTSCLMAFISTVCFMKGVS